MWRTSSDCLEGGLTAELGLEAARAKTCCQGGPPLLCLGTLVLSEKTACPGPQGEARAQSAASRRRPAGQSGGGTFAVHFREQLAQRPLHLPGAADEGRHHLEQLVLVLLPDHGDGLQDELHLLQLVSPWGGKCQMVTRAAHRAGGCGNPSA